MSTLDKSKPHGIMGCGDRRFFAQDNKAFDMGTGEQVNLDDLPKEKPKVPSALICKFCGAQRATPELMKEHLLAIHRNDMAAAKKTAEEVGLTVAGVLHNDKPETVAKEPEKVAEKQQVSKKKMGRPKKTKLGGKL